MKPVDKFLDSIILKQVKGSIYLVPAIMDIQIEELQEEIKQIIIDAYNDGSLHDYENGTEYFNRMFK
jgi:hypothetical protein